MSKIKIICLYKNRDNKGNIIDYVLKDEIGQTVPFTRDYIKAMMLTGKYEFVNLQIDKAGRLVDKALPKDTPQPEDGFYSIADLIRGVNPKGRKVKTFNPETGKEVIGIGVGFHMNDEMAHSSILVYFKEIGSEIVAGLTPMKDASEFWKEYSKRFPLNNDEKVVDSVIAFCRQNTKKHDLKMCLSNFHTYKVDAKPNPNGRYTILEVGKYKAKYEYDGQEKIYNAHMYRVRDKEEGREYWTYEYSLYIDIYKNEFTNAAIKDNGPAELIVKRDVPVTDCTELDKKIKACEDKLKSEFHKRLDAGVESKSDGHYFVTDQKEFDAVCNKVKKALDSLHTNIDFKGMLFNAFEYVVDLTEYEKTLYYGYMGDDSGWSDADAMFSFNKDVVKKHLDSQFEDWVWSTQQSEECSEEEAKARTECYRHTNIDEEEYDEE